MTETTPADDRPGVTPHRLTAELLAAPPADPQGPEYTPCSCSHIEPEHEPNAGACWSCDCEAYLPAAATVPAPAPTHSLRARLEAAIDGVFDRWKTGLGDQTPQDAIRAAVMAVLPAPADRAAPPSTFVLWLDASDGSVPTHDGIVWPDGATTVHHRNSGLTATHASLELAQQFTHGKQSRIVWPAPTDRAALSARLWAAAEHNIVAEWICCEPINPDHELCGQGDAARRMVKALLVDDPEAIRPAPLLDAVLTVLPDRAAIRAAALNEGADAIDAETRQAKADGVLEPDKFRPCRDASAQLRALAGCQECAWGVEHTEHCPYPESHNWGCGCPTDQSASGPGRADGETQQDETNGATS